MINMGGYNMDLHDVPGNIDTDWHGLHYLLPSHSVSCFGKGISQDCCNFSEFQSVARDSDLHTKNVEKALL